MGRYSSKEDKSDEKQVKKKKSKLSKEERRAQKKLWKEKVPKVDEDGISYTKLQIRRMMKRVKSGLPPVPTPQEVSEQKKQEALLKREEEAELAGLLYQREEKKEKEESDDDNDDEQDDSASDEDENVETEREVTEQTTVEETTRKRKKRSKAVPDDYVCMACQNKHTDPHWIYDCPDKKTVRGTNQVAKRLRGIHTPDDRKVFVSGLAFDMKRKDVEALFKECGKIASCKLLTFPDTGRCRGQAYVTFESAASAKKALKLSGTTIKNDDDGKKDKKKKKKETSSTKRKELSLKVTKVLSRAETKNKKA